MKISYQKRRNWYGYGFIGVWFVGAVIFFLIPLVQSFLYGFQEIVPDAGGMRGTWAGLEQYAYALNADPNYRQALVSTLLTTAWKTPVILIFSLFAAVLLNQKFRFRGLARAIFFLPVIIATGPVYNILSGSLQSTGTGTSGSFSTLFSADLTGTLMNLLGIYDISDAVRTIVDTVSGEIFGIVWNAGIQILIFLAALQSIPETAREAALLEGASGWEYFWKIILPYVSPMLLVCFIYTVTDAFTAPDNAVMRRIGELQMDWKYGEASAMVWLYFGVILAAIGAVALLLRRMIPKEVD